jgi:hypothetical protein
MKKALGVFLPLILCLPGFAAAADQPKKCSNENLKGQYVFVATGFQRAPNSPPGTPWYPKAILEVIQFNGDGTLTTPQVAIANPPGDSGLIFAPPAGGAPGEYFVNDDCSGTVHFFDAGNVTFRIFVDRPLGGSIRMIQTNPNNNAFQGTATRVD